MVRRGSSALLAAIFFLAPARLARAEDVPTAAAELVAAVAAEEAKSPSGRLALTVVERRGEFVEGERSEETRRRLSRAASQEASGTLLYGPAGWRKELLLRTGDAGTVPVRAATSLADRTLRTLVEGPTEEGPLRQGQIVRDVRDTPADALLARRAARVLESIHWTASRPEGDLLVLEGRRSDERHAVTVRLKPRLRIVRWNVARLLLEPGGSAREQTYTADITYGDTGPLRIDEWRVHPPPAGHVAYRMTDVKSAGPAPSAAEPALRFARGTVVTEVRGDEPVEYVMAEDEPEPSGHPPRAGAGEPAPAFELKDLKGRTVSLEGFRGRPVLLFWFSPASEVSEDAAEDVRDLAAKYRTSGVQFLALSVDRDARAAEALATRFRWPFPVLLDAGGEVQRRYLAGAATPQVAIVEPGGKLFYVQRGLGREALETLLDALTRRPEPGS